MRFAILAAAMLATAQADTPRPFFSPRGGCTAAAVAEIGKARKAIVFEAYSFTSAEILDALQAAARRGVTIQAVFDRSQKNKAASLADELQASGAHATFGRQKIMHNKVIVIDGRTVITGSFNFTHNAEHFNAENMVVIRSAGVAKKYLENFAVISK